MNNAFANKYKQLASTAEHWLSDFGGVKCTSPTLAAACSYSLFVGGKRLRPSLVLAAAEMLGILPTDVRSFALAVELVHTASLIHDDLPALDNDALRRGQPSCHVKFSEAVAVVAGDALLGAAFGLVAADESLSAEARTRLCSLLSSAVVDLCSGQVMDIEASHALKPQTRSQEEEKVVLRECHLQKTASLIKACVLGPAALLEEEERAAKEYPLALYGSHLGLLFQITDDILDAASGDNERGATTSSEGERAAMTYVSVYGMAGARQLAQQSARAAKEALAIFQEKADFLRSLVDFVATREA